MPFHSPLKVITAVCGSEATAEPTVGGHKSVASVIVMTAGQPVRVERADHRSWPILFIILLMAGHPKHLKLLQARQEPVRQTICRTSVAGCPEYGRAQVGIGIS